MERMLQTLCRPENCMPPNFHVDVVTPPIYLMPSTWAPPLGAPINYGNTAPMEMGTL